MFKKSLMFMNPPAKGEITISPRTKESLEECLGSLKNAVSISARSDSPDITYQIADVLRRVDGILSYNQMLQQVEEFGERLHKEMNGDNF
jgi:hypothetical protein